MRRRVTAPSGTEQHRRWLELVDTDGPFLAVPALKRVWPQGMPQISSSTRATLVDAKSTFERAWDTWDAQPGEPAHIEALRAARDAFAETVVRDVAGWAEGLKLDLRHTPAAQARGTSPNRVVTVEPDWALVRGDTVGALVLLADPCDSLHDVVDDGWAACPIDRAEAVLRASGVPLAVVTDGRWWALVSAQADTMVASGVVDSQRWVEEPDVRDAFLALLSPRQLVGGAPEDRTAQLFLESVTAAEDVTEALGTQVRRAVELLVSAFAEAAQDARRRGSPDPLPVDRDLVYQAAVTAMMRVVFLLFAEERSLLPQGRLFTMGYGISGELDVLDARAREEGTESLDATALTWHRLLATSRALYAGATFEDMRLPSYGGSLFDSARFPFLTARDERGVLAVPVSDRVMLEVLRSVQVAQLKGQPARRISFRAVDVEQIGYIYEGLLGYSCADVDDVTVGLIGAAGAEPEMTLDALDDLAELHQDDTRLAEAIIATVKASQPGATPASKAAITKALRTGDQMDDVDRALLAVTRDRGLIERLRPYIGIIRRDLRDRPMVFQAGGLVVVETPSRATSGAHYTPKSLAREVVLHALEPLVYRPGPHQTAERDQWQLLSSDEILDLKVADIACGSGAFLVAAAEYLGERLLEAWHREGVARGTSQEMKTRAVRQVVANCLYGADINGMAVEMCKLSLWLVSLDPKLPFSFVDDKVLLGNSLLGLTDLEQLRALHIRPGEAKAATLFYQTADGGWTERLEVDAVIARAVSLRQRLASEIDNDDPQRSAVSKRRQWDDYQQLTGQLSTIADAVVAAGLIVGGKKGRALEEAYENLRIAAGLAYPKHGEADPRMLDAIIESGLTPTVETDHLRWKPLHWALVVPDVMTHGGFNAVIGNPPFLGGFKLTNAMGANARDWLINVISDGTRGAADLVAYFFLRATQLLTQGGSLGLIATNTLAQGDTRDVGLSRMVAQGFSITRSIQSRRWPAKGANLEYAAVWGRLGPLGEQAQIYSDDRPVARISPLLEAEGRTAGPPARLAANSGIAFKGGFLIGMGFVIDKSEVDDWIATDRNNELVLTPYLGGDDLYGRPDCSASRWVIDFFDRDEAAAARFSLPFARVRDEVRPVREKDNMKARREKWWQHGDKAPRMRAAIARLNEVLALTVVSKTLMPMRVSAKQLLSNSLCVFATDSYADQAVLSSSLHQLWAVKYGSGLRLDPRYTPSDVFETFPRPEETALLCSVGRTLDTERRELMLSRDIGATQLYNRVNDPAISMTSDSDVGRMREVHVELDQAVMAAYGWDDVPLDHGFHTYRQMERWTVSPAARVEILDRLLEENHRRAARQGDVAPPSDDTEVEE
ncbi:Eco57I restriction-modification methylase domain-containing protein [Aquipuribacter nitratireducens]|uniref:site-specific DNA-methyltransferase (adenine-specific) n=1 Tax=Aquipuribacter nitratireducens TaxID=650104 RepID=A0ABW0GIN7_9MICO